MTNETIAFQIDRMLDQINQEVKGNYQYQKKENKFALSEEFKQYQVCFHKNCKDFSFCWNTEVMLPNPKAINFIGKCKIWKKSKGEYKKPKYQKMLRLSCIISKHEKSILLNILQDNLRTKNYFYDRDNIKRLHRKISNCNQIQLHEEM